MHKCKKCGCVYLRVEDKDECESKVVETPLIQVGKILIDESYGEKIEIRCYAIRQETHSVSYCFEWFDDSPDSMEWKKTYVIHSNRNLIDNFGSQIID